MHDCQNRQEMCGDLVGEENDELQLVEVWSGVDGAEDCAKNVISKRAKTQRETSKLSVRPFLQLLTC